ncbi:hypothetical protein BC827DRAFT_1266612 [Russula dissimulans]|nr:hypothetical protein BC827DRAFT_1266612 [Russula dissimulans]
MYSKIAEEEDNKMVERWQKDAEGMIIFSGLFSAVLTALVVVSVQDLRPNSQDTSAFYLEKLYELQANSNGSRYPHLEIYSVFDEPILNDIFTEFGIRFGRLTHVGVASQYSHLFFLQT